MQFKKLFTSESVSLGHPDKICDIISDTILDAYLVKDPTSRVAVETLVSTNFLIVAGEINSKATFAATEIDRMIREKIKWIGYDEPELGFSYDTLKIVNRIHSQSADIAQGVVLGNDKIGAGDQGMMYGFATVEGPNYYPLAKSIADAIIYRLTVLRMNKALNWIKPDMKTQVTVEYRDEEKPIVNTVVASIMHSEDANIQKCKITIRKIVDEVLNEYTMSGYLAKTVDYEFMFNPTGRFVIGGPNGDTGVTGRKIIVDSYGGYSRHGGGAFSGKDYTKVDRSASYAARYVAKNLVAAGFADILEFQLAYAIGVVNPVSIEIDTFGTGKIPDLELAAIVDREFDLRPFGIITTLKLTEPIYAETASFGHFNNPRIEFTWEKLNRVIDLQKLLSNYSEQ